MALYITLTAKHCGEIYLPLVGAYSAAHHVIEGCFVPRNDNEAIQKKQL